mgnify:CR=1 FL=1
MTLENVMSFIGAEPSSSMKSGRRIFTLPDMNIRRNCPVWNRTNSGRRDIRFSQVDRRMTCTGVGRWFDIRMTACPSSRWPMSIRFGVGRMSRRATGNTVWRNPVSLPLMCFETIAVSLLNPQGFADISDCR